MTAPLVTMIGDALIGATAAGAPTLVALAAAWERITQRDRRVLERELARMLAPHQ